MRRIRLLGLVTADLVILVGSLYLALWIRIYGDVPASYLERAMGVLPFFATGGLVVYWAIGLYSRLWRYASLYEAARIVASAVLASAWLALLVYFPASRLGFIDDDPMKQGKSIHGVMVLGSRREMPSLIKKHKVNDVVIAMPSAPKTVARGVRGSSKVS